MRLCAFSTVLATTLLASPALAANKALDRYLAMTPADYQARVIVKDDNLETTATANTLNGFQEKRGLLSIVWNDVFLRGFVNKQTGIRTYQGYAVLYWTGSSWPFFRTVNIALPSGTQAISVDRVGSDVDCSGSRYGSGCTYTEQVVFELSEDAMRAIAATYSPGAANGIAMRFKGQGGVDMDMVMMPAEFSGFMQVMDGLGARYVRHAPEPSAVAPEPVRMPPATVAPPSPAPKATPPTRRRPVAPTSPPPGQMGSSRVRCVTCR